MANETVYFTSDEIGAPTLNNTPGAMIAVLDACLVNGFNTKGVTSIVVASQVATVTCSAHNYTGGRMVDIAGVTGGPSGYATVNGRKKITATGPNTFTFPAVGVADGNVSGTLTAKRSSLGWTKPFSGTNLAMYKRSDVTALAQLLRIDDRNVAPSSTTYARALMVESATAISTYTGAAPTTAQISGPGQYWSKGPDSADPKVWLLIGDSKTFYLFTESTTWPYAYYSGLVAQGFGDLKSYRPGDAYSSFLMGDYAGGSFNAWWAYSPGQAPSYASLVLSRLSNQFGSSAMAGTVGWSGLPGSFGPTYPSNVDQALTVTRPVFVAEESSAFGHPLRGEFPGAAYPLASIYARLDHQIITAGPTDFLCVGLMSNGSTGCMLFDITAAWQ